MSSSPIPPMFGRNCSVRSSPTWRPVTRRITAWRILYVYFYELALRLMKPGGLMCFVVTNKWMKASYGEPLRRHFAEQAWVESVVDFGHAKQIFEDADVFPCIIVARRPDERPKPTTTRLCAIPREQLRIDDLSHQIEREGVELPLVATWRGGVAT